MYIVVTALLDDLLALLRKGAELPGLYESSAPEFLPRLRDWLAEAEEVLRRHRRAQVAELAGLRAQLRAAEDGVFDIHDLRLPPNGTPRKLHRAVAALLFNRAQSTLGAIHESFAARRDEALKYVRQMILLALQKNTFYPAWNGTGDRGAAIARVWQTVAADADMATAARHVLSLSSYADALRLVDEVITEWGL